MVCDSHSTKPSSFIVGTRPVGFIFRYSGVLLTPNCSPASMRSYFRPSSSTVQSAFFTLTELTRPQIFSIDPQKQASESHRLAVAPRVAGDEIAAFQLPDGLAAAELVVVVDRDDAVAAALQLLEHRRLETVVLDAYIQPLHHPEARAVARGLRALPVVRNADQHLRVALRLHGSSHDAEAHDRLAVLGDEAWNDGLVRTLARTDLVRMAGLQDERSAAVLQRDAVHHDAGAEAHVVGLDERDHHAGGVCGREVNRAARRRLAVAEV